MKRVLTTAAMTAVAGVTALAMTGAVQAATSTSTFNVTATVVSSCSMSVADLSFGSYDPLSATPTLGSTTVSVTCSLGAPYHIGLNEGTNGSGTVTTRKMKITTVGGTDKLAYSLTRDLAGALNFGKTVSTDTVDLVGTGLSIPTTVYGSIGAGQNVTIGSYSDTITVTLTY